MLPSHRIKGFDGCRALAVVAVFLEHRTALRATELGHVAVLLFFALSGYLIVGGLHSDRVGVEAGQRSVFTALRDFIRRRTLRIFPIYYLALGVLAALSALGLWSGWSWEAAPWHLLYLSNVYQAYVLGTWQDTFGHLWSLAIEEQFYLFAAPTLLLIPARRHAVVCAVVVAVGACVGLAHVAQGASRIVWVTDSMANFAFLAMGGFARTALSRWRMPAAKWIAPACGLALLGLGLVRANDPVNWRMGLGMLEAGLAAAGLILALADSQDSLLVRFLEWRPLAALGVVSYAFYLYTDFLWFAPPWAGPVGHAAAMAVNFMGGLALATASWWLIEKPLIAWGRRARPAAPRTAIART
ncbi:acyltransferase [Phenylobacterium sp.]|uniref:acyltransferase family protein n=1 Tax=Phenylobacterium sp. TaxID=1871053 RepID=UPI0025FAD2EE|nr:acyltransferase [Phenylobacterium sp.]